MKLYRFTGTQEIFANCGQLAMVPLISSNLTQLRTAATKWRNTLLKANTPFDVRIEALYIADLSQGTIMTTLIEEDPEHLVTKIETLKKWSHPRDTK